MRVKVEIVNAFIDGEAGGNPAGVVVDAQALSAAQKLAVAGKVGLSETAFVSASATAALKLEFFTPTRQIAHCGHATIATFSLLRQLAKIDEGVSSKETIDGKRDILIKGDMAFMEQRAPKYTAVPAESDLRRRVLSSLRLTAAQVPAGWEPCVVDTGNSFLIVPLSNEESVRALDPEFEEIGRISEELDLIGYSAFSAQTRVAGRDAGARMFAPRYGIREEAATGMAAGPLACFLRDKLGVKKDRLLIEQGRLMSPASPSVITVDLETKGGEIFRLMAGGRAKAVKSLSIELE
jgi:PhzF family phenazine biosynthesis protein